MVVRRMMRPPLIALIAWAIAGSFAGWAWAQTTGNESELERLRAKAENAIASDWVEDEVNKAFAEERDRKRLVLFPVRIDDAVVETSEPWARKLRDQRNIGDFRKRGLI